MKVVILCGGKGTRLREETEYKPKPMALIGQMPIIWHIMKIYSHYGHKDFILCLGYKGEMFKEYFLNFEELANDFTLKLRSREERILHHNHEQLEDWNITFVDTGLETKTGARIARVKKYLEGEENFFLTYGDGLANVNINKLLEFHKGRDKIATLTCIHPSTFAGIIEYENGLAKSFKEKPKLEGLVNGGFMVCNKKIFDYLSEDDNCVLEKEPMIKLADEGQLAAYHHDDFWYAMNTYKEYEELNKIWGLGKAPWKIWENKKNAADFNFIKNITYLNNANTHAAASLNKDFWQNRNVFVTGCTGLLGGWLVKYLVDFGAKVTGLVRDWVPESHLCQNGYFSKINIVRGKLEDIYILERALGEYEIDTVFHLGAQTIVGIANRGPLSTLEANIRGSYNLLEACRRNPLVKRIIVASSDKAYGDQKNLPYNEEMPLQGKYPYDVSKSCVDLLSQAYFKTYKLPVCITRCGNFFGGGDLNFNRVVPGTIRSILFNQSPLIRSNGFLIRDYFYIEDAAAAYLLLASKMEELNLAGQAFNFSNENQINVLELVKKIIDLMGSGLELRILNEAENEIPHQYLSSQKARTVLGWRPEHNMEQGLLKTIDWYKNFFQERRDMK